MELINDKDTPLHNKHGGNTNLSKSLSLKIRTAQIALTCDQLAIF